LLRISFWKVHSTFFPWVSKALLKVEDYQKYSGKSALRCGLFIAMKLLNVSWA
jgi:hypothetical protein